MYAKLQIRVLILIAISITSCQEPQLPDSPKHERVTSIDSLSIAPEESTPKITHIGSYRGDLPCPDCKFLRQEFILREDKSSQLQTLYVGKNNQVITVEGKYTYDLDEKIITNFTSEKDSTLYKFYGNYLLQLDKIGEKITGKSADKYILQKIPDNFFNKKLIIDSITGIPNSQLQYTGRKPSIYFDANSQKFNGFIACNVLNGNYSIKKEFMINLEGIRTTKKACANNDLEGQFLKFLDSAVHYTYENSVLSLFDKNRQLLFRFKDDYFFK